MNQYRSPLGFLGNIPPVVKNIIMINVVMLILTMLAEDFMVRNFALFYPESPLFRPYQLLTHIFMHGGIGHLFFNMYAFWLFGSALEHVWGGKKFFIYYLVTGIGAAGFYMLVQWLQLSHIESTLDPNMLAEMQYYLKTNSEEIFATGKIPAASSAMVQWFGITASPMVGASGAVFGVLLAYGMLFPNTVLQLIFPPVALKAKWFVVIYGALELILGITSHGSNIAHFAHVGGMIFGYILIMYWKKKGRLYS